VYRYGTAFILYESPLVLLAGRRYSYSVLVDIASREDQPGELFDGTHQYRCFVGEIDARVGATFFNPDTVEDADTRVRYPSSRIVGNVLTYGAPMTITP
jgi:hypothetical protein